MNTATAVTLIVLAVLVAIGAVVYYVQRRRSQQMRAHYGAEYLATVDELGDRRKAETELKRREKRVESFDIRPLSPGEADRYAERWRKVQAEFVDDPGSAIAQADSLLGEVMRARGYPVSDFEQRAADLSVDHPKLVADYRIAHDVAVRHARGQAGTEDARRAMLHCRDLFAELIQAPPPPRQDERSFREEPEDERAARAREPQTRGRADDRATGERRTNRPGDGGATHV